MNLAVLPPRPCTHARRDAIAAACDALGAMSNDDLRDLTHHDESIRVRLAAALVLAGRETAVPTHPTAAEMLAAHTYGGPR